MRAIEALKQEANLAYAQLEAIAKAVSEPLAWAKIPVTPDEYLHTNGTIIGVVQHIAVCKFIYGSAAFRSLEVRLEIPTNALPRLELHGPESLSYLAESQSYWMSTWSELQDEEVDADKSTFRGGLWPAWKIIGTVTQHDAYHAGQIAMLASILEPTGTRPDMELEQELAHIVDLPSW